MKKSLAGIVLAAGQGKRMKSTLPKVLHQVLGKPMLERVMDALREAGVERQVVVLGANHENFRSFLDGQPELEVAIQNPPLGTGHAVAATAPLFEGAKVPAIVEPHILQGKPAASSYVLVLAGDTPALNPAELKQFIAFGLDMDSPMAVLAMRQEDPTGYGRIVLQDGSKDRLDAIVEEKDASPEQKTIQLCNTGIIMAQTQVLFELLDGLQSDNQQSEYYLTDCIELVKKNHAAAKVYISEDPGSFSGVNTPEQKLAIESFLKKRTEANFGIAEHR